MKVHLQYGIEGVEVEIPSTDVTVLAPAYIPGYTREELRSGKKELFPPSLWVSRELCEQVYTELMESFAEIGFKVCMAVGGHWPVEVMLRKIEGKLETAQLTIPFGDGGGVDTDQNFIVPGSGFLYLLQFKNVR